MKAELPGSIYAKNGRYYWKVQLPGSDRRTDIPLRPLNSKHAAKTLSVAQDVAQGIYSKYLSDKQPSKKKDKTLASLIKDYSYYAQTYYRRKDGTKTSYAGAVSNALVYLKPWAKDSPDDFGPLKLKEVQKNMITNHLARKTINTYVGLIRLMFKWGASEERVSSSIHIDLSMVQNLHQGRSAATEPKKITSVDPTVVEKIFPFTTSVLRGLIQVQMLTGMRSTELCIMRPIDLNISRSIWMYKPNKFKMEYQGCTRTIPIGPRAQAILEPFLRRFCPLLCPKDQTVRKPDGFIFSPIESERERREVQHQNRTTDPNAGNRPGTNRKDHPQKQPGEYYTKDTYRRAVSRAIKVAQDAGVKIPYFHPHQLRHTAGTLARKVFDLDTSKALLGHAHISATEIYAELDLGKAIKAAQEIG